MGQDEQDLVGVGQVIRDWMEAQGQSKEIPRYTRTHMKELVRLWDQVLGESDKEELERQKSAVPNMATDGVERRRTRGGVATE